jgi:hypothetical protein
MGLGSKFLRLLGFSTLTNFMGQNLSWQADSQSNSIPTFMETEGSVLY